MQAAERDQRKKWKGYVLWRSSKRRHTSVENPVRGIYIEGVSSSHKQNITIVYFPGAETYMMHWFVTGQLYSRRNMAKRKAFLGEENWRELKLPLREWSNTTRVALVLVCVIYFFLYVLMPSLGGGRPPHLDWGFTRILGPGRR